MNLMKIMMSYIQNENLLSVMMILIFVSLVEVMLIGFGLVLKNNIDEKTLSPIAVLILETFRLAVIVCLFILSVAVVIGVVSTSSSKHKISNPLEINSVQTESDNRIKKNLKKYLQKSSVVSYNKKHNIGSKPPYYINPEFRLMFGKDKTDDDILDIVTTNMTLTDLYRFTGAKSTIGKTKIYKAIILSK